MKSGIALIGNPGTGKSTILNGLVGKPVFSSGLSFASGRTKQLQEYENEEDGISYFDTPGLNDIDKRKQAGIEIDKLLRQNVSMKIIFVTFALKGRIQPEDATTINLVLDAITSVDTNDRFGIVINQAPVQWIQALEASPIKERSVRASLMRKRFTSHWCYIAHDVNLESKENGMLMNSALEAFINQVPETKPSDAIVKQIDTTTFEEKLLIEREQFEERERVLRMELGAQEKRVKMLERLADEFQSTLTAERQVTAAVRKDLEKKKQELEAIIKDQAQKIVAANEEAREIRFDLDALKKRASENELNAKQELEELEEKLLSDWGERDSSAAIYAQQLGDVEQRDMWMGILQMVVEVAPLVAAAIAFI